MPLSAPTREPEHPCDLSDGHIQISTACSRRLWHGRDRPQRATWMGRQNASMSLFRFEWVAIGWAFANVALASAVWPTRPVPWLLILAVGLAPLLLFFFADHIAARMYRGLMERFASDYRKPQSPLVIKLLGWVTLSLQTLFLLFY